MSFVIRCLDCGHAAPFTPNSMHCPNCNSQWREAEYDLEEVSKTFPADLASRSFDLWRYRELLPIHTPNHTIRLGEGGTPLIQASKRITRRSTMAICCESSPSFWRMSETSIA